MSLACYSPQDVCMSLAQLVQNAASANLNVLVGVADDDGEEADLCMGVVQLLLVRVILPSAI